MAQDPGITSTSEGRWKGWLLSPEHQPTQVHLDIFALSADAVVRLCVGYLTYFYLSHFT